MINSKIQASEAQWKQEEKTYDYSWPHHYWNRHWCEFLQQK